MNLTKTNNILRVVSILAVALLGSQARGQGFAEGLRTVQKDFERYGMQVDVTSSNPFQTGTALRNEIAQINEKNLLLGRNALFAAKSNELKSTTDFLDLHFRAGVLKKQADNMILGLFRAANTLANDQNGFSLQEFELRKTLLQVMEEKCGLNFGEIFDIEAIDDQVINQIGIHYGAGAAPQIIVNYGERTANCLLSQINGNDEENNALIHNFKLASTVFQVYPYMQAMEMGAIYQFAQLMSLESYYIYTVLMRKEYDLFKKKYERAMKESYRAYRSNKSDAVAISTFILNANNVYKGIKLMVDKYNQRDYYRGLAKDLLAKNQDLYGELKTLRDRFPGIKPKPGKGCYRFWMFWSDKNNCRNRKMALDFAEKIAQTQPNNNTFFDWELPHEMKFFNAIEMKAKYEKLLREEIPVDIEKL